MSEGLEVYRDRGNRDVEYGGDVCSTREGEEDRWIERERGGDMARARLGAKVNEREGEIWGDGESE